MGQITGRGSIMSFPRIFSLSISVLMKFALDRASNYERKGKRQDNTEQIEIKKKEEEEFISLQTSMK